MDLKKVKEKLERLKNGGNGGAKGFWKVQDGDSVIRITPNLKYDDSLMEFYLHYKIGGSNSFLCPKKNFQQKCPVCDFASKLWNNGDDESLKLAKELYAKRRFYSPVLVRGEEKEGIRWWSYSKTVYEAILKLMDNPDYGDITDTETGTDLIITYGTIKGKLYPDTTVQPRRHSSRLCDDLNKEECQDLIKSVPDIKTLLEQKSFEEIKTLLDEYLLTSDKDGEDVSKEKEKYGNKPKENKKESVKEEEMSSIDKAFEELGG